MSAKELDKLASKIRRISHKGYRDAGGVEWSGKSPYSKLSTEFKEGYRAIARWHLSTLEHPLER